MNGVILILLWASCYDYSDCDLRAAASLSQQVYADAAHCQAAGRAAEALDKGAIRYACIYQGSDSK
jgi:hypothetical protein